MKSNGVLKALAAFIGFVNALPAPVPAAELTLEDLLKLSEGFPVQNSRLEKRVGCNPDNLLRRLRDGRYSDYAGSFCSLFIQSTVTDTTEVAETLTTETETTLPPVTVTITEVSTLTDTDFSTSTAFIASTVYPYPQPQLAKRVEPIAYPSWLPATYPPSRVSSACSCFVTAPPPVIRTTKTIVTGTVTTFSETLTITPFGPTATESTTTVTTITSIIPVTKSIYCGITPACRKASTPPIDLQTDFTKEQCFASCLATEGCLSIQFGIGGSVPGVCVLSSATVEDAIEPWVSVDSPICTWWVMEDLECMYLD